MYALERWYRLLLTHFRRVSWPILITAVLLHGTITWVLLYLANEQELIDLHVFVRFYIVCISTVGWGTFSPSTTAGNWVTALWLIPLGLGIFGSVLAKLVQTFSELTTLALRGMKNLSELDDHILIFGWNGKRTRRIVDLIFADKRRKQRRVVLVSTSQEEHPLMGRVGIDFAHVDSFTDEEALARVAVRTASKIIVDGADDNANFTCALKLAQLVSDDCHISVYFDDASKEAMLEQLCPQIECSSSRVAEVLVRSMQDPGASRVTEQLLSNLEGMNQYALEVPAIASSREIPYGKLFFRLRQQHGITLLGVADSRTGQGMQLNPTDDRIVRPHQFLHYIAAERLHPEEIDWEAAAV